MSANSRFLKKRARQLIGNLKQPSTAIGNHEDREASEARETDDIPLRKCKQLLVAFACYQDALVFGHYSFPPTSSSIATTTASLTSREPGKGCS
jgi:hypothetical protein